MVFIKALLLMTLIYVAYQDIKERQVYWILIVLAGLLFGYLHFKNTLTELFLTSVVMNMIFVCFLFIVVYLYSRFKLKISFNEAFGTGDILFFIALAFTFSTVSFLVVFIFSLFFSIVLQIVLQQRQKHSTVPLAGYMSLFFIITYIAQWSGVITNLYSI